jgi:fluoride exporter
LTQLLWVGLGGFTGAIGRYIVSSGMQRLIPVSQLPYGTLLVNVVGCALIGALGGWAEARQLQISVGLRLFLFVGVLGGFTTFSAFAFETLSLARGGATLPALTHVGLHLVLCLAAVALGDAGVRTWLR